MVDSIGHVYISVNCMLSDSNKGYYYVATRKLIECRGQFSNVIYV